MLLYKFRPLADDDNYGRIIDIIENGFYCNNFLNFNDMNEGVFIKNPVNSEVELDDKIKYKICSFSGVNALDSELMWGHYANAGMGIVIEIDVATDVDNPELMMQNIKEVKYGKSKDGLNTIENILTHKSDAWSYEDEFRYIATSKELEGIEVKMGKITKIYFGTPYKNLINYDDFKEKHEKLKKYLDLKQRLEAFCRSKDIECEDFEFNFV